MRSLKATDLKTDKYRIFSAQNCHFPDHIHKIYEIMVVKTGEVSTRIDGKSYTLHAGECAVLFPMQHHAFSVEGSALVNIFLLAHDYIPEFERTVHGYVPECPVFSLNEPIKETKPATPLAVRAMFYVLCNEIVKNVRLVSSDKKTGGCAAVDKVMLFVDENYTSECDLRKAAEAMNYEYSYISRLFHKHTGYKFSDYLNRYRVDRACYLLIDTDEDITDIAGSVGYGSVRTFNREFRRIMQQTPTEYRRAVSKNKI